MVLNLGIVEYRVYSIDGLMKCMREQSSMTSL
jgi:hypothetical protein